MSFGRDVSCTSSLRPGRYVSGNRLVAEAIYRRLTTPRGMLRGGDDEANYGIDLLDLIGDSYTKATLLALPGQIQAECLKDERVEDVEVKVTEQSTGVAKQFLIELFVTTADGPFSLQVGVSEVTVDLLGIEVD